MPTYTKEIDGGARVMVVNATLHYIRGNKLPYFSVTADVYSLRKVGGRSYRRWESGGAQHELVLEHFPELAPLVALHLSDMDGVPMHAVGNGYYWLAGALGGLGEKYHGSNNGTHTTAQCRDVAIKHFRITPEEFDWLANFARQETSKALRIALIEDVIANTLAARWKAEADAAIKAFDLTVTGDRFVGEAA